MKHSSYFEGKVQSLGITTSAGDATVGVMEPGTYAFATSKEETMSVTEGALLFRMPEGEWTRVPKGESFVIPAGKSFECRAEADASYICYYC